MGVSYLIIPYMYSNILYQKIAAKRRRYNIIGIVMTNDRRVGPVPIQPQPYVFQIVLKV